MTESADETENLDAPQNVGRGSNYDANTASSSSYANFFQTDASSLLRRLAELERKIQDVHAQPEWLSVVFSKLRKLDELEETVHKLQLATPYDSIEEGFKVPQDNRYNNMLREEHASKQGTMASELVSRIQVLELEQERLQKLLAVRPTVADMQILKQLSVEQHRTIQRELEEFQETSAVRVKGLFASELEEFHEWRHSQQVMLQTKLDTILVDLAAMTTFKTEHEKVVEDVRNSAQEYMQQLRDDLAACNQKIDTQITGIQDQIQHTTEQMKSLADVNQQQEEKLALLSNQVFVKLEEMDQTSIDLKELINSVQNKAREDVIDVRKIAQVSRANVLEIVARHDALDAGLEETKEAMRQENSRVIELIGGLTIDMRKMDDKQTYELAKTQQEFQSTLSTNLDQTKQLSEEVTTMSQDLGKMLMNIGAMPGQINVLEIRTQQLTETLSGTIGRVVELETHEEQNSSKFPGISQHIEDLKDDCHRLTQLQGQMDVILSECVENARILDTSVRLDREKVGNEISGLDTRAFTAETALAELKDSVNTRFKEREETTNAALQKLMNDVDYLKRLSDEVRVAAPISGANKPSMARLKNLTAASPSALVGGGMTVAQNNASNTSTGGHGRSGSGSNSSNTHNSRRASTKGATHSKDTSSNRASSPSTVNENLETIREEPTPRLTPRQHKSDQGVNLDSKPTEAEDGKDANPLADAMNFFGELCLSFEEIAMRRTGLPEMNTALCDQITSVAQDIAGHIASTADADIISRVLRAKPSEVTYDDMVAERRINLLSSFESGVRDYVKTATPGAGNIVRMEARDTFLKKLRTALDLALSKHEQVLVTAHSRLGRVSIPTCIACDRPLLNRHRHLQRQEADTENDSVFAEGSIDSFTSLSKAESIANWRLPPAHRSSQAPPQSPASQSRPHTTNEGVRGTGFVMRGGFKMPRQMTRSMDSLSASSFSELGTQRRASDYV